MLNNGHSPSDEVLAGRIQSRAKGTANEAFELLFERYGEPLRHYLDGMVHSEPAAQDLAQETFLRVWTRAEQWSGQGSFKGWLYRIATNLALNYLRAMRRRPAEPLRGEDESAWDAWSEDEELPAPGWMVDSAALGPDAALDMAEQREQIARAYNSLPEEKREVFYLVHEMEMSIRDTAARLGIPEGTVKSRLHYADKKFTQAWQSLDTDQEEPK